MTKFHSIIILVFLLPLVELTGHSQQTNTDNVAGFYLGQRPSGSMPVVFSKIIASDEVTDGGCVFSNDGKELYYFIFDRNGKSMIMQSLIKDGYCLQPIIAEFSGTYSDVHPFFSNDNHRLYFGSNRPLQTSKRVPYCNLWFVEKQGDQWSEPIPVGSPINTGFENCASIGPDETLYFRRVSTKTRGDIFISECVEGKFQDPVKLPSSINSVYDESHPCVSPDGSYIIFSSKRPGGFNNGKDDLWISFKNEDGSWTNAINMRKNINNGYNTSCATISPDGKYLFFSSMRSGRGDTYWVDAKIIEDLKPANLKERP